MRPVIARRRAGESLARKCFPPKDGVFRRRILAAARSPAILPVRRRSLTAGQKAIATALIYPDGGKGGRGKKANLADSAGFSGRKPPRLRGVFWPDAARRPRYRALVARQGD
jgi:hypothetical protein